MKPSLCVAMVVVFAATSMAQTSTSKKKTAPVNRSTAMAKDIQALRETVTAQQQQMEAQRQQMDQLKSQLQQLLDATQQANASAQKLQGSADQAQTTAAQAQQSATDAQRLAGQASSSAAEARAALAVVDKQSKEESKKISALQDFVGRFRLSGDIRLRGEDIFQDCPACVTRNRARLRVRFGVDGRLNENFMGGFALATGSLGDPTSANETFSNFFDRKTIGTRSRICHLQSRRRAVALAHRRKIRLHLGPHIAYPRSRHQPRRLRPEIFLGSEDAFPEKLYRPGNATALQRSCEG